MPRTLIAGNLALGYWTVLDANFAPLTGMLVPGDVTLTLHRQSGSTMVVASEPVAWAEVGTTGRYYFSFTPTNTGLYVLELQELEPTSLLRNQPFDFDVFAVGVISAPTYADAYCSEADIERRINAPISASTIPDDLQAASFAVGRASILTSLCAGLGVTVTPATVAASYPRLENLLREANDIGAALDYLMAQTRSSTPFKVGEDRSAFLRDMWEEFTRAKDGILAMEIRSNLVSLSTDHILSGDTLAAPSSGPPTDIGIQTGMGNVY